MSDQYPSEKCISSGASEVRMNYTVVENINNKIAQLNAEIARLEESKKTLAPLLDMKIRDIREAMNY
jgi:uncharacterized small protein (DUF1192 family)